MGHRYLSKDLPYFGTCSSHLPMLGHLVHKRRELYRASRILEGPEHLRRTWHGADSWNGCFGMRLRLAGLLDATDYEKKPSLTSAASAICNVGEPIRFLGSTRFLQDRTFSLHRGPPMSYSLNPF